MEMRGYWKANVSALLVVLGALLASVWGVGLLGSLLHSPHFITGWILAVLLALTALIWWNPPLDEGSSAALMRRVKLNLWIGVVLLVAFLTHTELGFPHGWIERLVALGFVVLLSSTVLGGLIVRQHGLDRVLTRRWLQAQVAIHWSLVGLGLFHGIFTHTHGLLAHFFLPGHS